MLMQFWELQSITRIRKSMIIIYWNLTLFCSTVSGLFLKQTIPEINLEVKD